MLGDGCKAKERKISVGDFLFALRTGEDPVGYVLREAGLTTFTGSSISYLDVSGNDDIEGRMLLYLVDLIRTRINEGYDCFDTFASPTESYSLFLEAFQRLGLVEDEDDSYLYIRIGNTRSTISKKPRVLWKGCPNKCYEHTWVLWEV
jgi:hypothetical protein